MWPTNERRTMRLAAAPPVLDDRRHRALSAAHGQPSRPDAECMADLVARSRNRCESRSGVPAELVSPDRTNVIRQPRPMRPRGVEG